MCDVVIDKKKLQEVMGSGLEADLESRLRSRDSRLLIEKIGLPPHGCKCVHAAGNFEVHVGVFVGAFKDQGKERRGLAQCLATC